MLQAEICRRERFLKGVGHFDRPLKVEGEVAPTTVGGRELKDCPFMWYKNIAGSLGSLY